MESENAELVFATHPARARLTEVANQAASILSAQGANFDENTRKRLERTVATLAFAMQVVERADPELTLFIDGFSVIRPILDAISGALGGLSAANPGAVKLAVQQADALLNALNRFPPRVSADGAAELGKIISGIQSHQESLLAATESKAATAIQIVTTAQQEVEKSVGESLISVQELSKAVERLQQQIGKQSARLDDALANFTTNSGTLEQQRDSRYQEWIDKQSEAINTRANDEVEKITSLLKETSRNTDAGIASLNQNLKDARKILNVIGNDATTGNYQRVASANEKTADSLRKGAIALFLVLVVVVVWLAQDAISGDISWDTATFRLLSVLVLGLPAAYLARESSRHREVAERMQRMELELASIDAFNALLPKDEQEKIKAEMARKYFGNIVHDNPLADGGPMTPREMLKEMRAILRAVNFRR